jgi:glycosyltransferase involved in cell wall biosynthesis
MLNATRQAPVLNVDPPGAIRLMKVLATFFSGGTEGQVLNLTRRLDREQFELHFSCLRKSGDFLQDFANLNIPISEFNITSLYKFQTFRQQLRFAMHLKAQRVQISHSYNFYANMFAIPAARLAGTPVVLASIRDRGVYLTEAQRYAQKVVCSLADRILVNANSVRDWLLEQGYEDRKITVIRNGVDLSVFQKCRTRSTVREELGIPDSAPIIVMIARLNPQKGVEDFIRAAALIHPSHPEVRFLIVGSKMESKDGVIQQDREYLDSLQSLASELGVEQRVIFAGHRADTPAILAESTISVLPSFSEGLSNSLLESMAAGVPTIATNVGGNPELVKHQVNGLLIPVKSPERLAQAEQMILDNPQLAAAFGRNAGAMAREGFSLEKMAADTQALYQRELFKSKRGNARTAGPRRKDAAVAMFPGTVEEQRRDIGR